MSITRSVDQEKMLTIFTVTGELSFDEIKKALRPFSEEHPTKDLLWDLRNATMDTLSYDDLDTLSDYVKQYGEVRAGGKTAFVVSRDLEYGLTRMIEAFREVKDIPIQLMLFRSMEKAVQWLEEDK